MPARTIAIGDIHGCLAALETLIDAIKPTADDLIITLGDYVDRGPSSAGVIDFLLELDSQCQLITLKGNHEELMLTALAEDAQVHRDFWMQCGGAETLKSYGGSYDDVPDRHRAFLLGLQNFYETDTHIFVHANYQFDLPMEEQENRMMLWEHLIYSPPIPHNSGKTVVVGHTPQPSGEILDLGYLLCVDTGCAVGGRLSALEVQTKQLWQANKAGELLQP